jgi:hypothetical protein
MTASEWYAATERPEERALRRRLRREELAECAAAFVLGALAALAVVLLARSRAAEENVGSSLTSNGERAMMCPAMGMEGENAR